MPIRLIDVAQRAGVSSATVSRVLANKPHVTPEIRQRVTAAIQELGYQPSRVARSLRGQRAKIIGVIISDIQNPFFTQLVRAVEDVAYAHEHAIFLCNTDESSDKERLYIDLMRAEQVAGVVISPADERNSACHRLVEANIPVVAVDRRLANCAADSVTVDNREAAFRLVSHLIEDGHTRIAAVIGAASATTGRERYDGYVQALEAAGLPLDERLVRRGIPKEQTGYCCTAALLALEPRPTAVFTGNNLLTVGALRRIQELGLRIPDDIALAAFDELDWMSLIQPQLTVIAQPTYALGEVAAELLFTRIADPARPPQQVTLISQLIVRRSCAHHALAPAA